MQFRPHRYRTEFPTILTSPLGKIKVVINDVNETGALISTSQPLARGHKVELVVLNTRISAIVLWASRDKCGVTFRPHISIAQVDVLRYKQGGHGKARQHAMGYAEMR